MLEASGESGERRFQTEGGATAAAGEMEYESLIIDNLLAVCISARVCVFEAEVDSLRAENNGLKSMESQVVMTMRQNAQVASDYLNKMASHAHSSIRSVPGDAYSHQPQHQAVNAATLSLSPVSVSPVSCLTCLCRQLLGEAETLRLVSQLLQSIDKISSLNSES